MTQGALPEELLDRVESLTAQLDELSDAHAREIAQDLVAAVIAMYGDGLRRIIETIMAAREAGATIIDELTQDGAVASLLLIHDLYPSSLEERVIEALDTVRPYMESHGGNVELIGIDEGVARLKLQGSCHGCAASRATLELAIKQALDEHCPDLEGVDVEGVVAERGANGFELPVVHSGLPMAQVQPSRWLPVGATAAPGELLAIDVDGAQLVLANVDGSLLAYRNQCASCGERLDGGELAAGLLSCPGCGVEFDLTKAGRVAGGDLLQLTPVPLLESGGVRVAV